MRLINLQYPAEQVSFAEAVLKGQGRDRGLFFPPSISRLDDIDSLLQEDFVTISERVLGALIGDEIDPTTLRQMLETAFTFTPKLVTVEDGSHALELFHGPSLAFKDFGARFMAQCLRQFDAGGNSTILTATSGDTGAAVAHAFHGVAGINVVILYPKHGVTPLQEKLFCTLGGNIRTFAVDDDFDACQALVKQSFEDDQIRTELNLNSANSINIARLLAQVCYYFDALAALKRNGDAIDDVVISVPSGNFGNITAGAIAKTMGLPIKRLIAATNINDTVPRFFDTGLWSPNPTVPTLSNAMDISSPNNYVRLASLMERNQWQVGQDVASVAIDDATTTQAMRNLFNAGPTAGGYVAEPHTALAHYALQQNLQAGETGIFLGTAHPAKFAERVKAACDFDTPLPEILASVADKPLLSIDIGSDFDAFRAQLNAS